MRKTLFLLLLAGTFLISIPNVAFSQKKGKEIQYGSVQSASGTYAYCVAMGELINKKVPNVNVTVIETGASIENLKLIHRGDIDMGLATIDSVVRAYKGMDEFAGKPNADLRLLWPIASLPHNIIANQESGVNSIYELNGKKFNAGGTGTATESMTLQLFEALGIKPNWFRGDVSLARDAMKNRQIVGFVKSGVPDPSVMEVSKAFSIKFLEVSDKDFQKAQDKYGIYTRGVVSADSYGKGLPPKDIGSYNVVILDMTTSKLSQEIGYKMAKAIYESKDLLGKVYKPTQKGLAEYPKDFATNMASIYLHAGVVQLCKELGVQVPTKVIPPEYKK